MKENGFARLLVEITAFPAGLFLVGCLWSLVDVYGFGNWDAKFGQWGTVKLGITIFFCMSACACAGNALVVALLTRIVRPWTIRRLLASSLFGAIAAVVLLGPAELGPRIADPITRVIVGHEALIYLAVFATIPVLLMLTTVVLSNRIWRTGRGLDT